MLGQDESTTVGIGVAIGVAVIFAVMFVLSLLCGVLGFIIDGSPLQLHGQESSLWLAQTVLMG